MSEQKIKYGKQGALKEITKKLSELRKKPLSKKVFDIVQDNFNQNQTNKKVAKPAQDVEA